MSGVIKILALAFWDTFLIMRVAWSVARTLLYGEMQDDAKFVLG